MSMHPVLIRKKLLLCFVILVFVGIIQFSGIHLQLLERDFSEFEYPINADIYPYVLELRNNEKPSVEPINGYNYSYISPLEKKCRNEDDLRVVLIVKSSIKNVEHRNIIRKSWGYEGRFSDVPMKTVFLLGVSDDPDDSTQEAIENENKQHNDIVQANFHDKYFNNTIKTMMGFKWAVNYCNNSKYYAFVDDDMYLSVKNLLRFIRNPLHYPEYVEQQLEQRAKLHDLKSKAVVQQKKEGKNFVAENILKSAYRSLKQVDMDYELPNDAVLYAGHVFYRKPLRHYSSKWYLNLEEYPFNRWPPYIPAGAYVLSKEALELMYHASYFVKHFRFDDIYLAILAKKMGIQPFHSDYFYYQRPPDYKYVIAFHNEYGTVQSMFKEWIQQKAVGNA